MYKEESQASCRTPPETVTSPTSHETVIISTLKELSSIAQRMEKKEVIVPMLL